MGKSDLAQLYVQENNVYVVWRDNSPGNEDIYFAKSSDGGASFNYSLNLSNNTGGSEFPRMAVVNNNIYATWYDYTTGQSEIFFSRSYDSGNSFQTINLSNNGGVSYNPWIAAYNDEVFVVWNDETPQLKILNITKPKNVDVALGSLDILFATSHDNGVTFEISNISNTPDNSWNPRIAIYENNIYVVWNEKIGSNNEIFFTASTDGAKSFSKPTNLSMSNTSSMDAGIQAFGNHVYVIWQEATGGGSNIFFTHSDNNGGSFSSPAKISTDGASEITRDTQMIASEKHVLIVWFNKSTNKGVFFVKSNDNGKNFTSQINLSGNVTNPQMAQISSFGDSIYVTWQDRRFGNSEVFLRSSIDNGRSYGSIINLSNDDSESNLFILGPQITSRDHETFVVFEKLDTNSSDLFLQKTQTKLKNGTMVLQTLNNEVFVEVGIDKAEIEPETPLTLSMKFLESSSGIQLENVSYSFSIQDISGNLVIERQNQLAKDGQDTQAISFPETGPYTITINVESVGVSLSGDNKYVGSTSALITVVPEFPFGIILALIIATMLVIIVSKFKIYQSLRPQAFN